MPPTSRHPLLCARGIKRQVMGTGALIKLAAVRSLLLQGSQNVSFIPCFLNVSCRPRIEQVRDQHFALRAQRNKESRFAPDPFQRVDKSFGSPIKGTCGGFRSTSIQPISSPIPYTGPRQLPPPLNSGHFPRLVQPPRHTSTTI